MKLFQNKRALALILTLSMLFSMFAVVSVYAGEDLKLKPNSQLTISKNETEKIIYGMSEATSVDQLLANFENAEAISVFKAGVAITGFDHVGTGDSVVLGEDVAYVVLEGDTDGSGRIDSTDYLQIKRFFLETYDLKGVFFEAADTDNDGVISTTDYLQVKRYFLGSFSLYPEQEEEESSEADYSDDYSWADTSSKDDASDIVFPSGENVAYDELPKKDLEGREIYIIERWFGYGNNAIDFTGEVLYMEDDNGSLTNVNKAKKDIIETIQKDYNCKINGEIFGEGSTSIVSELKNRIAIDITAGTGNYDFFFESFYYYTSFIADGMLLNIKDFESINLNSSCWDQNAVSELSICNALYFVLGDINTYDNDGTVVMLFNKDLYDRLGYTEDLYQLVKDRKWTFDKLVELSSFFQTIDHNDDGLRNEFDNWFMGSETANLYTHVIAAGESICTKDKNDEPQLTMLTENTINALTDAVEFYISGQVLVANLPEYQGKYPGSGEYYEKTVTNAFLEGRELFYMTNLACVPYYRFMEDEFGILPVPMYSESQDEYYSQMSAHMSSALMIPNTFKADEDLGLIIQSLCELSEEKLTPEYYKKQLEFRIFRDEESAEMLDIIFDNRHYDLGAVFGQRLNLPSELYCFLDTDIENRFEEKQELLNVLLENMVEEINEAIITAE